MDQCGNCTLKGDLVECKKAPCSHHETWYAGEQQKKIDELKEGILESLDWNWLDEDYPKELQEQLLTLAK